MKIAYVYDVIYPYIMGGVEKRIWELARRLVGRGHEVTIFGMKYWDGEDIIYNEGVRLWGVCSPHPLFSNGHRSVKESLYVSYKLLSPLHKERFDIIDVANFPYFPCFSAKFASVTRRSKLFVTWHEVWNNYWFEYLGKKGLLGKIVERMVARLSNKFVVNSESTKRGLKAIGVKDEITVIPNGVDFLKAQNIASHDKFTDAIYIGRLLKEKNIQLLVKAINCIRNEKPDIRCTIIGNGPERENLKCLIHELNLNDNIHLEGCLESEELVFSSIKSSKVFVLPSVREGFGLVVLV